MPKADFRSDNTAGASPEIFAALERAGHGRATSYGDDACSRRLRARFSEIFERDVLVYPVVTGSAGNCLALAAVTPPFGAVFCHRESHINSDECGAPAFFTGGAKLVLLEGKAAKIDPKDFARALAQPVSLHQEKPAALSLSQLTERGALYDVEEIAALCALAKQQGLAVHMDGARFANALAASGRTPAEMTWKAGVDLLVFGATKNGALLAEALIVFDRKGLADVDRLRKRAGHLLSKMRFVSAQLEAYLEEDLWLRNAAHANAMAATMAAGLANLEGARILTPVQGNQLFVQLPLPVIAALQEADILFYPWGAPDDGVIRLVTSFATEQHEIEVFLSVVRDRLAGGDEVGPAPAQTRE
jgi:threonine aldolase